MKESSEIEAKAKVFWEGGFKTRSIIRGFEVSTDKPKTDFGTNTAPAPLELFISGIGACVLSTFIWAIWKARITVADCTVDIKASAKTVENNEKIINTAITLTVWAEKNYKNKIEKCFEIARTTCPLTNAVSFPLEYTLQFKEEK